MSNRSQTLIGLTGQKGSGKSTVARYLIEHHGFSELAFATMLKEEVQDAVFDTTDIRFALSATDWATYCEQHKHDDPSAATGWVWMLWQAWGTMRRDLFGDNYWVRQVVEELEYVGDAVVISDVRAANEAAMIRARGGVIWRIERPGLPTDPHPSEHGIGGDVTIPNDGSLDELYARIDEALVGHTGRLT